jgi:hypothetical protein
MGVERRGDECVGPLKDMLKTTLKGNNSSIVTYKVIKTGGNLRTLASLISNISIGKLYQRCCNNFSY